MAFPGPVAIMIVEFAREAKFFSLSRGRPLRLGSLFDRFALVFVMPNNLATGIKVEAEIV